MEHEEWHLSFLKNKLQDDNVDETDKKKERKSEQIFLYLGW